MAKLTVNFRGIAVNNTIKGQWEYPTIATSTDPDAAKYANGAGKQLEDLFPSGTSSLNYSNRNTFGSFNKSSISGLFVPIQNVINFAYAAYGYSITTSDTIDGVNDFAGFIQLDDALISFGADAITIGMLGSQVNENVRNSYDETSSGVFAPDGLGTGAGGTYVFGLIQRGTDSYRFALGQLSAWDANSLISVMFTDAEGAIVNFTNAVTSPQWKPFKVAVGPVPVTPPATPAIPSVLYPSGSVIVASPSTGLVSGGELRFALERNDLLGGARIYYYFSTSPGGTPSLLPNVANAVPYNSASGPVAYDTTYLYGYPSAQNAQGGALYVPYDLNAGHNPSPVDTRAVLPIVSDSTIYCFAMAYGYGALNSAVHIFTLDFS